MRVDEWNVFAGYLLRGGILATQPDILGVARYAGYDRMFAS